MVFFIIGLVVFIIGVIGFLITLIRAIIRHDFTPAPCFWGVVVAVGNIIAQVSILFME